MLKEFPERQTNIYPGSPRLVTPSDTGSRVYPPSKSDIVWCTKKPMPNENAYVEMQSCPIDRQYESNFSFLAVRCIFVIPSWLGLFCAGLAVCMSGLRSKASQ